MDWQFVLDNIRVLPIALFAGWLGKVWAERIARNEDHSLSESLEKLRQKLELQQNLIAQAQQHSFIDRAEITRRQLDTIDLFWLKWLEFRNEVGKFHILDQTLTPTELKTAKFPFAENRVSESISKARSLTAEVEKMRPFLPVSIYQHFKGLSVFYLRLGLRWDKEFGGRAHSMHSWFVDNSGKIDFSVKGLIKYSVSISLNLPNPETEKDARATFCTWKEKLEGHLIHLINEFVDGSLSRQLEIHQAIREISSESATEA